MTPPIQMVTRTSPLPSKKLLDIEDEVIVTKDLSSPTSAALLQSAGVIKKNSQMTPHQSSTNTTDQNQKQFFVVSSYTDFDRLAHGPRGTPASRASLYTYELNLNDGSLCLQNVNNGEKVLNPAYSAFHPRMNVVYTCTEDVLENGKIIAFTVKSNGELTQLGDPVDAGGTSTCYITVDQAQRHLIVTNYWNSTLCVIPLCFDTGRMIGPIMNTHDPNNGEQMKAAAKKHGGVNHSNNDASTISERQKDPHSHALELDPFVGCIAYVPDLGKDLIRELFYDQYHGKILGEKSILPSGLCTGHPDGPRYLVFHPRFDIAYVVNELSCTIAVFAVNRKLISEISRAIKLPNSDLSRFKGKPTLTLIQSIKTIPDAFPVIMNTCGRVAVHPSGNYVVVSNRGHESVCVYRVTQKGSTKGQLAQVGFFHCGGETPRHFQFDSSGQYLLIANQDSDSITVFNFNLSTGVISFTGHRYCVPSPNFICDCLHHGDDHNTFQVEDLLVLKNRGDVSPLTSSESLESDTSSETQVLITSETENHQLRKQLDEAYKEINLLKSKLEKLATV